jgi:plastocyanin
MAMMRLALAAASTVVLGAAIAPAAAAPAAAPKVVNVADFAFNPLSVKDGLGKSVQWSFQGPSAHTATDASGIGIFDSGAKTPGQTFTFAFTAAGTYDVMCTIHTFMTSKVLVAPKTKPRTGSSGTHFTITWATAAPLAGRVFDVQIKRPGDSGFTAFMTGTTATSATFTPDHGSGMYQFEARVRRTSNGAATGFSPAGKISVS